jgi:hypothetical protein
MRRFVMVGDRRNLNVGFETGAIELVWVVVVVIKKIVGEFKFVVIVVLSVVVGVVFKSSWFKFKTQVQMFKWETENKS